MLFGTGGAIANAETISSGSSGAGADAGGTSEGDDSPNGAAAAGAGGVGDKLTGATLSDGTQPLGAQQVAARAGVTTAAATSVPASTVPAITDGETVNGVSAKDESLDGGSEIAMEGESNTTLEGESGTALDGDSAAAATGESGSTATDVVAADAQTGTATPAPIVPAQATASPDPTAAAKESAAPPPVSDGFHIWATVPYSVPGAVLALPTSPTLIADDIEAVQTMVAAVIDAMGPLTLVPGDLYALLGVPVSAAPPSLIGVGHAPVGPTVATPAAEAPLFGPVLHHAPVLSPSVHDAPLFGTLTPRPALGAAAPFGMTAPLAVSGTVPMTVGTTRNAQSFFEHVLEAVLVPASLTALAAVALPGIGGLLAMAAAGVRLGYRQAKAGLALRLSGIARFAGPESRGVARTGSLITLRQRARGPRTRRAVCPEAARQARTLEPVA